ncbi:hypothetical protein ACFWIZ_40110 [Streptomyces sp. NPDC127044]
MGNLPSSRWTLHGRWFPAAVVTVAGQGGRLVVPPLGRAPPPPPETVNPAVIEAMAEAGIDLSAEVPKVLTIEAVQASVVVMTMGCGDACPVFPGKQYRDWKLDDPAGQGVEAVRSIRDEIEARVRTLLADLLLVQ